MGLRLSPSSSDRQRRGGVEALSGEVSRNLLVRQRHVVASRAPDGAPGPARQLVPPHAAGRRPVLCGNLHCREVRRGDAVVVQGQRVLADVERVAVLQRVREGALLEEYQCD